MYKLRKRGQRKGRELRIEGREYTERSKRVGNQRESKEIEQIECKDRWRVGTKRAEGIVSRERICVSL